MQLGGRGANPGRGFPPGGVAHYRRHAGVAVWCGRIRISGPTPQARRGSRARMRIWPRLCISTAFWCMTTSAVHARQLTDLHLGVTEKKKKRPVPSTRPACSPPCPPPCFVIRLVSAMRRAGFRLWGIWPVLRRGGQFAHGICKFCACIPGTPRFQCRFELRMVLRRFLFCTSRAVSMVLTGPWGLCLRMLF